MIFSGIFQTSGVNRHRFGPTKNEPSKEHPQDGKNHRAHGVDVGHRVQADPPQGPPCRISQLIGGPSVSRLMNTQRQEKCGQRYQKSRKVDSTQVHTSSIPQRFVDDLCVAGRHRYPDIASSSDSQVPASNFPVFMKRSAKLLI